MVLDGVRLDLADALAAATLRRQKSHPIPQGSRNVGGWKSDDLFQWGDSAARAILEEVSLLLGAQEIVSWAMVNRQGNWHETHHHASSIVSAVYYADPGDDLPGSPASSPTVFLVNPGEEVRVDPIKGRLAVFPGWLSHRVPTYTGTAPRVTIVFDVRRVRP